MITFLDNFIFFLGTFHEKRKFKYFKNLTVKICKIWCNDVYMSILQCDIFWWKLIDRNFFNPIFKIFKFMFFMEGTQKKMKLSTGSTKHVKKLTQIVQ